VYSAIFELSAHKNAYWTEGKRIPWYQYGY